MKMNADNQMNENMSGKENRYPLDVYIKKSPAIELSVDFSTLGKCPFSEEDLTKLREIKELVTSAEDEINSMALKSARQNGEVFHIQQPSYFDDNFDQEKYVRDLVNAKFQGMKIIEHENTDTKVQKIIMLKKAFDKINKEDSSSSEAITVHKGPSIYQIKMENNATTSKYSESTEQKNDNLDKKGHEVPKGKFIKVQSQEIVVDQKNSEEGYNKLSRSNHKVIEIKSLEAENHIAEKQLVISKTPGLSVEVMPSINIRSQLIEQKIPSLDIFPTDKNNLQPSKGNNVAIINTEYQEPKDVVDDVKAIQSSEIQQDNIQLTTISDEKITEEIKKDKKNSKAVKKLIEKNKKPFITNENVSYNENVARPYVFLNKNDSSKSSIMFDKSKISKLKKYGIPEIQQIYNPKIPIHKKCPEIFTRPTISNNKYLTNISKEPVFLRKAESTSYSTSKFLAGTSYSSKKSEYIPYTKLTIGGYKPDEVEKIISSKRQTTPINIDPEETVDIDPQCNETLSDSDKSSDKNESDSESDSLKKEDSEEAEEDNNSMEQYLDDFDIDCRSNDSENKMDKQTIMKSKKEKISSLGLKSKVDVFDFVDYVKTKDDSTQSSPVKNVSFRETQTTPEQDCGKICEDKNQTNNINVNNITIADMLQIQKIMASLNLQFSSRSEEEKNGEQETERSDGILNVSQNISNKSMQRDTQTSPAKMVGQILSPIFKDKKIDAGTSPWDFKSQIDEVNSTARKIPVDHIEAVAGTSNGNTYTLSPKKLHLKESTDALTDMSQSESSETHSLGEINLRILKRRSFIIRKQNNNSDSTSTSLGLNSSSDFLLDSIKRNVPMKSDGEISEGQILKA